jgi:hypothetical protein
MSGGMKAFGGNSRNPSIMRWLEAAVLLFCMMAIPSKLDSFDGMELRTGDLILSLDDGENVHRRNLLLQQGGGMDNRSGMILMYPTVELPSPDDSDGVYYVSYSAWGHIDLKTVFGKKLVLLPKGDRSKEFMLLSRIGGTLVSIKGGTSLIADQYGGQVDLEHMIHLTGNLVLTEGYLSIFHHQDIELIRIPLNEDKAIISPLLSNTMRYTDEYGASVSMELGTMLELHVKGFTRPLVIALSGGPEILFTGHVWTALNTSLKVPF